MHSLHASLRPARTFGACLARRGAFLSAGRRAAHLSTASQVAPLDSPLGSPLPRVLSGVQPTGELHLGNYLGAIRQWCRHQGEHDNYFCIVDLHAVTVPQDPVALRENTLSVAALYLACGLDPAHSKVFVQSHVPAHAELAWLLNCVTPMGWLNRMVQFKEKSGGAVAGDGGDTGGGEGGEGVGVGLYAYPILMAADILLYQARFVPVGDDQRQHLELARDIARRFNKKFGSKKSKAIRNGATSPIFTVPTAMIQSDVEGARVMSLRDGTAKMSKSHPDDNSRINLLDSADVIARKIKKCKSDSVSTGITFDPARPEARNLLGIYQSVSNGFEGDLRTQEEVLAECEGMNWGTFKPLLAESLVEYLRPVRERYHDIREDPAYLMSVLREGSDAANETAGATLEDARRSMGFLGLEK